MFVLKRINLIMIIMAQRVYLYIHVLKFYVYLTMNYKLENIDISKSDAGILLFISHNIVVKRTRQGTFS